MRYFWKWIQCIIYSVRIASGSAKLSQIVCGLLSWLFRCHLKSDFDPIAICSTSGQFFAIRALFTTFGKVGDHFGGLWHWFFVRLRHSDGIFLTVFWMPSPNNAKNSKNIEKKSRPVRCENKICYWIHFWCIVESHFATAPKSASQRHIAIGQSWAA